MTWISAIINAFERYFSVKLLTFNIRNNLLLAIYVILLLFSFSKTAFKIYLHLFMTNFDVKPGAGSCFVTQVSKYPRRY